MTARMKTKPQSRSATAKSTDPLVAQLIALLRKNGVRCGTGAEMEKVRKVK